MRTEFYKTFKTATIDSLLLKLNQKGYVKAISLNGDGDIESNHAAIGANDTLETKYGWRRDIKGSQEDVYIRGNWTDDTPIVGKDKWSKGERRRRQLMNSEEWLYQFLEQKEIQNSSIFNKNFAIDYDKEYLLPFSDERIFKVLMLLKWLEGLQSIKANEQLVITSKDIKEAGFEFDVKSTFQLIQEFFSLKVINSKIYNDKLYLRLAQPTYNLNGGPGYIKFDISGPNQLELVDSIMKSHKSLIKS